MKPMYSRALVDLSLELHIHQRTSMNSFFKLRHRDMPIIHLIWETYGENTRKLNKDVKETAFDEGDLASQGSSTMV